MKKKTLKKAGRPKKQFWVNEQELTDEHLIYLIDYDFYTIRELEKDVGAGKNQLRKHYCFSRYSDEQKREELEKTLNL